MANKLFGKVIGIADQAASHYGLLLPGGIPCATNSLVQLGEADEEN